MLESRSSYHQKATPLKSGYIAIIKFADYEVKYETPLRKNAEAWAKDIGWLEKVNGKAVKKEIKKI